MTREELQEIVAEFAALLAQRPATPPMEIHMHFAHAEIRIPEGASAQLHAQLEQKAPVIENVNVTVAEGAVKSVNNFAPKIEAKAGEITVHHELEVEVNAKLPPRGVKSATITNAEGQVSRIEVE